MAEDAMPIHPKIFRLRQTFPRERVEDIESEVQRELAKLGLEKTIRPGARVAITAGSRGIANIQRIIKAAVVYLRSLGAEPFIVPAMGSHGGATAEGQRKVLESYGITEAYCGCLIRSSMETVVVGQAQEGFPVHFDRQAYEADHVLVCGRIKPHTRFAGALESGLLKMMLIGLGKQEGARIYHAAFEQYSFDRMVRSVAGHVLRECRIVAGLAIVENAYDETAKIEGILPRDFVARETELLKLAKAWMARLPFARADIVIVDEMGKNISGTGLDTNIVGRKFHDGHAAPDEEPKVTRIIARSLTPQSHGNATGIGIVDFCPRRLADQIDLPSTWVNGITSGHIGAVKMPPVCASDRETLDTALTTIGLVPPENAGIVWIRNTLDLAEVECSSAYLSEAQSRGDLEVLTGLRDWPFDAAGELPASMVELR
jgi:nickel-dependent lactate racemase